MRVVNVCFHGIGAPQRRREPGEDSYWISRDVFLGVLDTVVGRSDVRLSFDEYEAVRQYPCRFFNVSGHETTSVEAGAERIIAVAGELTVVEKVGVAGDIATEAHERPA